jgi:predicted phosphodiesterase/AraC-like DNA-binding protein
MAAKTFWTKKTIAETKRILKKSTDLKKGMVDLSLHFNKPISEDSVRSALRRNGEPTFLSDLFDRSEAALKSKESYEQQQRTEKVVSILNKHMTFNAAMQEIEKKLKFSRTTTRRLLNKQFGSKAKPSDFLKRTKTDNPTKSVMMDRLAKIIKQAAKKKRKVTFRDICDELDMAPAKVEAVIEDAISFGYKISFKDDALLLNRALPIQKVTTKVTVPSPAKRRLRVGVVSDTHFGSDGALKDELKHFVDVAYDEYGVRTILHCGDILAGNRVYKGQEAEVTHWGCDAQVGDAVANLPKRKNLEWYGILGNHDASFIKLAGIDVGEKLADKRSDFNYIGALKEKIIINGIEIELAHLKSSAHARSYSLEKHVYRTYSKSNQPQALFCGHKHANGYFEVQRIHTFLVPCFEDPSLHLQYCDFQASIGGLIVDFVLDEYANIVRVEPSFHLYHHQNEELMQIQTEEVKGTKTICKTQTKAKKVEKTSKKT